METNSVESNWSSLIKAKDIFQIKETKLEVF